MSLSDIYQSPIQGHLLTPMFITKLSPSNLSFLAPLHLEDFKLCKAVRCKAYKHRLSRFSNTGEIGTQKRLTPHLWNYRTIIIQTIWKHHVELLIWGYRLWSISIRRNLGLVPQESLDISGSCQIDEAKVYAAARSVAKSSEAPGLFEIAQDLYRFATINLQNSYTHSSQKKWKSYGTSTQGCQNVGHRIRGQTPRRPIKPARNIFTRLQGNLNQFDYDAQHYEYFRLLK